MPITRLRPFKRLLDLRRRGAYRQAIDDELTFHIAEKTDALIARGWNPEQARAEAERAFGDAEAIRASCREIGQQRERSERRRGWIDEARQDVVFGLRQLRRSPSTTVAAILSLVLGIGAATALFSVAHATLIQPLPFRDADRLARLWTRNAETDDMQASSPDFLDWQAQATTIEDMAAAGFLALALTDREPPLRLNIAPVSASFFRLFGFEPALGRGFTAEEDRHGGPSDVAVLSHRLFVSRFQGDRSIVGRPLDLDGRRMTVVGVMPEDFAFPAWADLWIPLAPNPGAERDDHDLTVVARIAPGHSFEQAQAELDQIAAGIAAAHPRTNEGWGIRVSSLEHWLIGPRFARSMYVLLAAVGLLVLLAAVNVANLLIARGVARRHEISLRAALGAGRGRLMRQLLTEGLLLAIVGGVGGVVFAHGAVSLLHYFEPSWIPFLETVKVNGRVITFALVVTLATGILFATVPTRHTIGARQKAGRGTRFATRSLARGGRSATGRGRSLRAALVAIEVAVATLLLIGAGLLFDTFLRLQQVDTGFRSAGVLLARIQLPTHRYSWQERGLTGAQLEEAVRAVPGVTAVGFTNASPFGAFRPTNSLRIVGRDQGEVFMSDWRAISPSYFDTLDIPVLEGRAFTDGDHGDAQPVTIISRAMADALWPDRSAAPEGAGRPGAEHHGAIGAQIDWGSPGGRPLTVIGVVDNVRDVDLTRDRWTLYRPHKQLSWAAFDLLVRSPRQGEAFEREIREAIWSIDPDLPVPTLQPLESSLRGATEGSRSTTALLLGFASISLILAASGLYGLTLFAVEQRHRELGIRLALGARPGSLVTMIVRGGARLAILGGVAGTIAALILARFLDALLYGTGGVDVSVYGWVLALLLTVTILACYLPARRAARLDPAITLRAE